MCHAPCSAAVRMLHDSHHLLCAAEGMACVAEHSTIDGVCLSIPQAFLQHRQMPAQSAMPGYSATPLVGCNNSYSSSVADANTCSLYHANALDYNTPLEKDVGVMRGANVTFTSGKPAQNQCSPAKLDLPVTHHHVRTLPAMCNAPAVVSKGHELSSHCRAETR